MKKLSLVDERTGEIDPEGFPAWIYPRIKSEFGREWFMASQEALLELATDKEFSGETYRVFFYMAAHLDFENYIRISQKEIADQLKLKNTNVSRAVRKLKEKALLVEGKESGRSKTCLLYTSPSPRDLH